MHTNNLFIMSEIKMELIKISKYIICKYGKKNIKVELEGNLVSGDYLTTIRFVDLPTLIQKQIKKSKALNFVISTELYKQLTNHGD